MTTADCTEIQGLMPLFVGGDLEAGETDKVAEHLGTCDACFGALEQAGRAREALRTELFAQVEGHEPQLWPALRESLAQEGLFHSAPVAAAPPRGGRLLSFSKRRHVAAAAAGLFALAYIGWANLGGLQGSGDVQPNGGSGGLAETRPVVERPANEAAPAIERATLTGSGATLASEPTTDLGGLRPVAPGAKPLFDQARDAILEERARQSSPYFYPNAGPRDQGSLTGNVTFK